MPANLCGSYHSNKTFLSNPENGLTLILGIRKNPSLKKPKYYLVLKDGNLRTYISSLYPLELPIKPHKDSVLYEFDYLGTKYRLTHNNNVEGFPVIIEDSPFSNNIGELGVKFAPTPKPTKSESEG
jgi:hypothetical protein